MKANHGISAFVGLLMAAAALSSAVAQAPQPTTPQPAPHKALIEIYRRNQKLYPQQPFIFVNNYLLAWLRKGTFATIEVPPGLVVVSVSAINLGLTGAIPLPDTKGYWTTLPGCDKLDSSQLAYNAPALLDACKSQVADLFAQCGIQTTFEGCMLPGCIYWRRVIVPECNWKLIGTTADMPYLFTLSGDVHQATERAEAGQPEPKEKLDSRHTMDYPIRFQAEAGKTYYVRYSTHQAWGRLDLVSEEIAAKDLEGLQASANPSGPLPQSDAASETSNTPPADQAPTRK